jgi:hypothetical protein
MYCWKRKSAIDRRYTGTKIVYTSAIAAVNWKLVSKNIHVYMTLEKHLKRVLGLKEIHILCYVQFLKSCTVGYF